MSLRLPLAFGVAVVVGVFLAVAGNALDWTDETTFVVGAALIGLLSLLGTPLILLRPAAHAESRGSADSGRGDGRRVGDGRNDPRAAYGLGRSRRDSAVIARLLDVEHMPPVFLRNTPHVGGAWMTVESSDNEASFERMVARVAERLEEERETEAERTSTRDVQRVLMRRSTQARDVNRESRSLTNAAV